MVSRTQPGHSAQALVVVNDALCRIGASSALTIDNFRIEAAQHWCIAGSNGAGKSLLANLIRGELAAARNHVTYGQGFRPGSDIITVSFEQQQFFQEQDQRHDISEFTAEAMDVGTTVEQLVLGARPGALADKAACQSLLELLDITALAAKGIRYLSSGQIRKALIARALFAADPARPKLLILDDPLESIDRQSRDTIIRALGQWMTGNNSTLLLTRRARDILPGITHLALMKELTLREHGSIDKVKGRKLWREFIAPNMCIPSALPPLPADRGVAASFPEGPLIELVDVIASYGEDRVLTNINWTMKPGQHTLIEGPNGSGKSTLLSLIDGENHKAYGQNVTLFGRRRGSGETVWEIKSRFGVVSNELHNRYVKGWKVLEVVVSGFYDSVGLYDDSGVAEQQTAFAWLKALGIEKLKDRPYHTLSFGQQRLVLLARAMVKHPRILILDEPCVGLDDQFRHTILGTLDLIAATIETQIVYVSHTQGEEPACINQRLCLEPATGGGFSLRISEAAAP
ncbi:MAG: ATP-binding cassette domain-containing protein [Pseudohongiellaceae bacterium]